MLNDPLSEAREALREIASLYSTAKKAGCIARDALARLDALPAPVRWGPFAEGPVGAPHGWFYPDAPVTDVAAPRQQPPAAREPKAEGEAPDLMAALEESLGMKPQAAREDGGEDAG